MHHDTFVTNTHTWLESCPHVMTSIGHMMLSAQAGHKNSVHHGAMTSSLGWEMTALLAYYSLASDILLELSKRAAPGTLAFDTSALDYVKQLFGLHAQIFGLPPRFDNC